MENLGMKEQEINNIMRIVAIVLHIGNIAFKKKDEDSTVIEDRKELDIVASLLEIPADNLAFALCHQVNITRGEKIVKPLNFTAASDSREAVSRALYGWMFTYIVDRINSAICKNARFLCIGVLDIFGFEDFKVSFSLLPLVSSFSL